VPTVLIADDSPTIRGFVRLALRGLAVEIVEAEDGAQAVEKARAAPPTLALIDVNMPVLDGLGATRALRADANPTLRALPILLLTAERGDAVRAECLACGADGVIDKPLKIPALKAAVERLLEERAQADGSAKAAASAAPPGEPR
jgi:CheY-like chemotaxis protein